MELDAVGYAVIYDPASGDYADLNGKPVNPDLASDMIVYDPDTGTYKDI